MVPRDGSEISKIGRRPLLTEDDMRKLARVYTHTDISTHQIRDIFNFMTGGNARYLNQEGILGRQHLLTS